ncbi:MAG TPA: ROK family protein [Acidimicrobiales bacterium]|nr:ROK family protein [Acidimicrobiales bacterium]
MRAVGIDIGGTKMLGVVVDAAEPTVVLHEHRLPTPYGTDALVEAIAVLCGRLDPGGTGPLGLGIPGLVDVADTFREGPNLPGVVDLDVHATLGPLLGRPIRAANDATCATYAEFTGGAARGVREGVLLTLGTGIGGGVVVGGVVQHGANGFAGEPGHMLVDPRGPRCPCGRRGCWERYASGSGLGMLGREAAVAGRLGAAVSLAGGDPEAVRGEHVVEAARSGDAEAGEVLDEFAWWLAAGIANLIDLLDPAMVVLGGGVIEAADVLLHRVRAAVPGQVLGADRRPEVPVEAARFGEHAGAIGAAVLALQSPGS